MDISDSTQRGHFFLPERSCTKRAYRYPYLLQQFISELREMDKAVMLLYLEEKSHKEIAEIVGLSESNVGTKISRIKTNLTHKFSTLKNQF